MTNIVITGASAGVGRAVARRFAAKGNRITLIARNKARLEKAAEEIRAKGGEALVQPLDVADTDAVEAAAVAAERAFGPIDIWINIAMVTVLSPVAEMTPEEYRRVTEVTYLGTVNGTLSALKRFRQQGWGTIVQTGSALAYRAVPLQSAYCAAKAAIVGFTDSLRSELIHEKSDVKITVCHLPAVNTPQFDWARNKLPNRPRPVAPVFQPELIADGIHHAAFHPKREYWLGFSAVKAILSEKISPELGDLYLARTAISGQQTEEPADPTRADNLYDSVDGDWEARGRFSDEASDSSPAIAISELGGSRLVAGGGAALVAGLMLGAVFAASRHRG
ncbi:MULTISPECIES: SDR family oxidoreductase [Thioclava]|uniref:SDR family oxidoreductase n=1 Tax=Thioclava TaxID=285107 RepID=UPI000C5845D3|nr:MULTISPECIES: SDR family oxidoreductase [Thioclava]MAQ37455.1 short-chain dehydrogenase [Thioclava sp.]|tara:strand:- start:1952 stop:2956 length:1005 start_codon:yes stop_codon:yes gene_type:complete